MSLAYVDSSAIVAIILGDSGGLSMERRLHEFTEIWSANLLEAEVRSVCRRERRVYNPDMLGGVNWLFPDRPLTHEISMVVETGYVRGADLWHLAMALYVSPRVGELTFVTLDRRQGEVARALGFRV